MSPRDERFYSEYFDQAGNQKKLMPGEEWIQRDPEPEEPAVKRIIDNSKSKIKVMNDFIQAGKRYSDLVADANDASRYGGRAGTRGDRIWSQKLKACQQFKPTYVAAEAAAQKVLYPIVKRLFPDFEIDETPDSSNHHCRTSIGHYLDEIDGHIFMTVNTRDKNDYWNKMMSVIIRDDGLVLPEFSQIFKTKEERAAAWKAFCTKNKGNTQPMNEATLGRNTYVLTGYDKKTKKMNTHVYNSIDDVAFIINSLEFPSFESAPKDQLPVPSPRDLDFDAQACASHLGAKIIETSKFIWSVFFSK